MHPIVLQPSTWALLAMEAGALLFGRRRRCLARVLTTPVIVGPVTRRWPHSQTSQKHQPARVAPPHTLKTLPQNPF